MLALAAENDLLKIELKKSEEEIKVLKQMLVYKGKEKNLKNLGTNGQKFGKKLKNLFKYYIGLIYVRFCAVLEFLVAGNLPMNYKSSRSNIKCLNKQDGPFFNTL
ncbi:hypothetical protein KUTeg_015027 [Tegillarca granosa]|uniref:Uncharacterized protein n=1 Tax=Tegillarca granosa TaxID=220873 RepID=A0ABQ9EUG2_TEGGR|nr:hypothetical protein KUTeg_015027 [Tegillarca granosa]